MAGIGNLGIALGNAAGAYEQGQQLQLQQQNQKSLENYRTQELQLQQQAMQNAQKRQQFQQIQEASKAIWDTLTPYVEHGLTVGQSPQELTKHAQPMLDSLARLEQSSGLPPSVMSRWTGLVSQPSPADVARKMAEAKDPLKTERERAVIAKDNAQADALRGRGAADVSDIEIQKIANYEQSPPPNNPRNPGPFHDIMSRVYAINPDYDVKKFNAAKIAGTAEVRSEASTLTKMVQQKEAISAFENTAIKNGDILVKLGEKVDKTGVPIFERFTRPARQLAGDTDVAEFNTQLLAYRSEVAKILANPNLSGQLTDTARKEVEKFIAGDSSAAQIRVVHELLKGDFGRRSQSLDESISGLKKRIKDATGVNFKPENTPGKNVPGASDGWEPTSIPGVRIREKQ